MTKHGDFIWYELMTPDADAASRFYQDVFDWRVSPSGQPGMDYRLVTASAGQVAGILALDAAMIAEGAHAAWLGYLAVDDVDASAASIEGAGGRIIVPPSDIPDVGRFAMVADPQGAPFYIMRGAADEASNAFAAEQPLIGHCAWNELATTDPDAAKAFYGAQFGWVKDGELQMGDHGTYEFLRHETVFGAVFPKVPEQPVPCWTFYFRVADVDRAVEAVTTSGGRVLGDPVEIPGGEFAVNGMDPQGAAFAFVGPRAAEG